MWNVRGALGSSSLTGYIPSLTFRLLLMARVRLQSRSKCVLSHILSLSSADMRSKTGSSVIVNRSENIFGKMCFMPLLFRASDGLVFTSMSHVLKSSSIMKSKPKSSNELRLFYGFNVYLHDR